MATFNEQDRLAWLQGSSARCNTVPECYSRPYRLVLLGAPGVGKGTQAELLNRRLHSCHLSTGDVLRSAGKQPEPTAAMKDALGFMRRGELVPDTTMWDIVSERSECLKCGGGFILDGFPRTLAQAVSLQSLMREQEISLSAVVNYVLPVEAIVARLSGRRTCEKCKAVYHVTELPPKAKGECDHCSGKLLLREDDKPEAIKVRLETYLHTMSPLVEFYDKLKLLVSVDATGSPEEIFARTLLQMGSIRKTEYAREIWVLGQE